LSHSTAGRKSAFLQSGPAPGFEVVVVVVVLVVVVVVLVVVVVFCVDVAGPGDGRFVAGEVVVGFGVVADPPDGVVLGGRSHSGCK
jgi:hypothetical protein